MRPLLWAPACIRRWREKAKRRLPTGKEKLSNIGHPPYDYPLRESVLAMLGEVYDRIAAILGASLSEDDCIALMSLMAVYTWKFPDGLMELNGVETQDDSKEWAKIVACFHPDPRVDWKHMERLWGRLYHPSPAHEQRMECLKARLQAAGIEFVPWS